MLHMFSLILAPHNSTAVSADVVVQARKMTGAACTRQPAADS